MGGEEAAQDSWCYEHGSLWFWLFVRAFCHAAELDLNAAFTMHYLKYTLHTLALTLKVDIRLTSTIA